MNQERLWLRRTVTSRLPDSARICRPWPHPMSCRDRAYRGPAHGRCRARQTGRWKPGSLGRPRRGRRENPTPPAVFESVALAGLGVVPAKSAPLEYRVQRMRTSPRDRSRPPDRQRSQKPRRRSFSGEPVRPWLTSQFVSCCRDVRSMGHYAAQSARRKARPICRETEPIAYDFARVTTSTPVGPYRMRQRGDRPIERERVFSFAQFAYSRQPSSSLVHTRRRPQLRCPRVRRVRDARRSNP